MPPEQITLSLRPRMRKRGGRPPLAPPVGGGVISTISLVTRGSGHTSGALMIKHPSGDWLISTEGNGVYHSDASGPLMRRRAICDRVSVIPYVLHTALGKLRNSRSIPSSIAPPPIIRCLICINRSFSSGTCNELYTCIGTIAANVIFPPPTGGARGGLSNGCPEGSTVISFSPRSIDRTTIILPAI